ncbi:hypothetical protein [Shewanella maritima]|uniref:hypothetical protein n=1 Tax=Shewanella maritima TaxID=2520507 RepID=UPI003736F8E1
MDRIKLFMLTVWILFAAPSLAQTHSDEQVTTVKYNISAQFVDPKQAYYISMLELALSKSSDEFGPYKMQAVVLEMPQGRTLKMVQENALDVVWTMTSVERETTLQAVYIPLLKGLMGYRIGIIRKGEQYRFDQVNNLNDFRQQTFGQGTDWPDVQILERNGFKTVTGSAMNLLTMLAKQRFDYFPRAIHEPWDELLRREDIEIEQQLLLKYPAPIYFFVNKSNSVLAKRIEHGLHLAIEDGSFERLFAQHPITTSVLEKANIDQRQVFEIANPLLSPKTVELLSQSHLWYHH